MGGNRDTQEALGHVGANAGALGNGQAMGLCSRGRWGQRCFVLAISSTEVPAHPRGQQQPHGSIAVQVTLRLRLSFPTPSSDGCTAKKPHGENRAEIGGLLQHKDGTPA